MRKWSTQASTVVVNVGRELSLLKMAINMANADYPSFFLWNELEPRCQQRAAGSLELIHSQIWTVALMWWLGFKLSYASKRGPWYPTYSIKSQSVFQDVVSNILQPMRCLPLLVSLSSTVLDNWVYKGKRNNLTVILGRGHSGYGLSQWEQALLCNVFSHWRKPYPEWSLHRWKCEIRYHTRSDLRNDKLQ